MLSFLKQDKINIKRCHNTTVRPDDVHYKFLRQLPGESLELLLKIYNNRWINSSFPDIWKQTTIIPVPKPEKDNSDPENYRPISLTSCLCKTMERMINDRLMWYMQENKLITDLQCGFRKKRSTMNHLIHLELAIRDAFFSKNT